MRMCVPFLSLSMKFGGPPKEGEGPEPPGSAPAHSFSLPTTHLVDTVDVGPSVDEYPDGV